MRQRVAAEKGPNTGPSSSELRTVSRTARCAGCNTSWTYQVVERFEKAHDGTEKVLSRIPEIPDVAACPDCRRKASEAEEARIRREEAENRRRLGADAEMQLLEQLHHTGANPWEHHDSSFETFDSAESGPIPLEAAREFVQVVLGAGKYDPIRGLFLCGPTGSGKTHLAVACIRELLHAGVEAKTMVFDHALSLIMRIQDTYSTGESARKLIERRVNARLWVLDDLGTEKPSDDVVRRLTTIVTERGPRATLITSNLTPQELTDPQRNPEFFRLASRLGPRNFRRIRVMGHDRRADR